MFSKIFANLCVCVLAHNALQHLLFCFSIFDSAFKQIGEGFFCVCAVCCSSKCENPRSDLIGKSRLQILLIFVQNVQNQLKHKQNIQRNKPSLLYKFLLACCKSGPNFISALKIVHRSPGSHDKIIHIIFFGTSTSLTKFESCSKFTGEHPCRSAISIKLQSNFIEISLRHGCFS